MMCYNNDVEMNEIFKECKGELISLNIPIDINATIKKANLTINSGICEHNPFSNTNSIKIAQNILDTNNSNLIKKIMTHELLHTCPDCLRHTGKWLEYAKKVDEAFHYGIMEQDDTLGISNPELPILSSFKCPKCGAIYKSRTKKENCKCTFCNTEMTLN